MVHKPDVWQEIDATIQSIGAGDLAKKISKEKTMRGKELFSPKELNIAFKRTFDQSGWEESRTSYWVTDDYRLIRKTIGMNSDAQREEVERAGKHPIFSDNQTDFVKERVAVEVQFGKYSFIAYDLFVKHLAFYVGDEIDVGIEILPMKTMQARMSSGPG